MKLITPKISRASVDNQYVYEVDQWCSVDMENSTGVATVTVKDQELYVSTNLETTKYNIYGVGLRFENKSECDPFVSVKIIGTAQYKTTPVYSSDYGYKKFLFNVYVGYSQQCDTSKAILPAINDDRELNYDQVSLPYFVTPDNIPYFVTPVEITYLPTGETWTRDLYFKRPEGGKYLSNTNDTEKGLIFEQTFAGLTQKFIYHVDTYYDIHRLLKNPLYDTGSVFRSLDIWEKVFDVLSIPDPTHPDPFSKIDGSGVKSLWTRKAYKPNLDRLGSEHPLLYKFLLYLCDSKTVNKISNNKLIASFIQKCGENYDTLYTSLKDVMDRAKDIAPYRHEYEWKCASRSLCLALPGAVEAEDNRKTKEAWQYQKSMTGQAGGLGISENTHSTLWSAIKKGDIPLSIFHAPGNKEHIVNEDFDLWEIALNTKGWYKIICAISQDASRRTTYEKPVTSYLSFLLYTLPKYLDRTAPLKKNKKWRCMPTFVESQWQLEMDEADEEGTVKKRSALTPVADNIHGVVTVPYVSMAISGHSTTYCYSGRYYVAETGLNDPEGDGVFTKDFVEKLNGRDDYGLMFYTLIGTSRNTGYPSFLIIFERLFSGTRVHFHRVRPNRSKNGIPVPTSQLIEECYRYMAGNVRAEDITAQQGDLIFIKSQDPKKDGLEPISEFESHRFVSSGQNPLQVIKSIAKAPANRLGWLYADAPFSVQHPEHDDIDRLDAGWWEIRRCKSWEANPTAVWSYTID